MRYKAPKPRPEAPSSADAVEVVDRRFNLDVDVKPLLSRFRLTNTLQPVLAIGLVYDPATGKLKVSEALGEVVARAHGYFFGASLPAETVPGYYPAALDRNHRLLVKPDTLEPYIQKLTYDSNNRLYVRADTLEPYITKLTFDANNKLYVRADTLEPYITKLTFTSDNRLQVYDSNTWDLRGAIVNPGSAETYTTTPLGANAVYYGPSRDFIGSRLGAFGVIGFADQASAPDGVYVQLSIDNTNWDYRGASVTAQANAGVSLCQVVTARYARAVWMNGPTAQSVFRFGGRYFIAGSENPPLGPSPPSPETAVCADCGEDRTESGDFFFELDGKTFCPKCYANRRYKEMVGRKVDTKPWLKAWGAFKKLDESRAKAHAPDEFLRGG